MPGRADLLSTLVWCADDLFEERIVRGGGGRPVTRQGEYHRSQPGLGLVTSSFIPTSICWPRSSCKHNHHGTYGDEAPLLFRQERSNERTEPCCCNCTCDRSHPSGAKGCPDLGTERMLLDSDGHRSEWKMDVVVGREGPPVRAEDETLPAAPPTQTDAIRSPGGLEEGSADGAEVIEHDFRGLHDYQLARRTTNQPEHHASDRSRSLTMLHSLPPACDLVDRRVCR